MKNPLIVSSSPHISHLDTTSGIMLDVIIALLPSAIFGCVLFGLRALFVLLTCIICAVLSEFAWTKIFKKPLTVTDLSAALTGLLLGMSLPPTTPLWMAALGSVFAIIVMKQVFGGLGKNLVNPVIAARFVLSVAFYFMLTKYIEPIEHIVSSATPLASLENEAVSESFTASNLFFGRHSGSIGETSAFLLIIGGLYLVTRNIINPITPLSYIGSVALFSVISGEPLSVALFGGGLMFGAIFMATDYTTSPVTNLGKLIFGLGCGIVTFMVRKFTPLPEGVSCAIILMNLLVPIINRFTLAKPFGFVKAPSKKKTIKDFIRTLKTLLKFDFFSKKS